MDSGRKSASLYFFFQLWLELHHKIHHILPRKFIGFCVLVSISGIWWVFLFWNVVSLTAETVSISTLEFLVIYLCQFVRVFFSLELNSSFPFLDHCFTVCLFSVCAFSLTLSFARWSKALSSSSCHITFPFLSFFMVTVLCTSFVLSFLNVGKYFGTFNSG